MVTIRDVAKLAGVSPSTASRVMNDSAMISEATKQRVRQAMKELDYSPNYSARNLVKRHANTIGIVLPVRENQDFLGNNPFFMQLIQGIASVCTEHQFMVSLATGRTEEEMMTNLQNLIRSGHIAKFIFLYSKKNDPVFQFMLEQDVACVVVGQSYGQPTSQVAFVDNDNYRAGQDVATFLLDKGYTQICYAYTDMNELVQADRYAGYEEVMRDHQRPSYAMMLSRVDSEKNEQTLRSFLQKNRQIQAFITCDDAMAIRLQKLFKALKISSRRYAIISFNNSVLAEMAMPSLSSVEIFPMELGQTAARLVLNQTGQEEIAHITHEIIERDSTPNLQQPS
ncbi:LacI family DNA-binding transcriptional regulator [Streptococcus cuniculipharyngis]|uniref:LacI family transcriptional regulator n=1 Tax=Streptococcus cuniculipharyngis TaxID=1562651 RepID=A0A5C5SBD3_9STRE|nr:LacI family DNA-binding transcriptional regulator [Streptococcus cuniculipharyngis]TWS97660.1 LacI family transcriptional regulator [Streptococcus cuniculipharyngis]